MWGGEGCVRELRGHCEKERVGREDRRAWEFVKG